MNVLCKILEKLFRKRGNEHFLEKHSLRAKRTKLLRQSPALRRKAMAVLIVLIITDPSKPENRDRLGDITQMDGPLA